MDFSRATDSATLDNFHLNFGMNVMVTFRCLFSATITIVSDQFGLENPVMEVQPSFTQPENSTEIIHTPCNEDPMCNMGKV